jgi:aspartyl-tRNA(Asn)/glutamyl-tRNA(Gln) amidotransferase subunit A
MTGIRLGALHGVPVAVKDNIRVLGTRTTASSRVLLDAPFDEHDAPAVRRMREAGAILVGKLNLSEFARGEPDPDGPFKNVQNPRRMGHQSGSSSSGSAAAVAAGLAVASLGTDTGGSIRHPASVCGVVGLKPTYGLVSLEGVVPMSPTFDTVGPLGRSVADVAACLTAVAGHEISDPTSLLAPVPDYLKTLDCTVRGLRLGLPTNADYRFGRPEAHSLLEHGRQALLQLGLLPVDIDLSPSVEEAIELSKVIIDVDLWVYIESFLDREALFGRDFIERSRPAKTIPAVVYARAVQQKADIRRRWLAYFEHVDLIVLPGNVAGAPPHGQSTIDVDGEPHPVQMVCSRYNRISNITGFPAIVIPVGVTPEGLPIGLQLVGPPLSEARLLAVAHALEQHLGNLPAQWGIEPR